MIAYLLLAPGLVLILEGLVFWLAPSFVERALEALRALPVAARRQAGQIAVVTGLILLLIARQIT